MSKKVSLSRLNSLITAEKDKIRSLQELAMAANTNLAIDVFEKTTNEELNAFKNRLDKKHQEFADAWQEIFDRLAYISYLKQKRDSLNKEASVNKLIIERDELQRKIDLLSELMGNLPNFAGSSIQPQEIQSVETYQSSYTATSKIYRLCAYFLSESDCETFSIQLNDLRDAFQKLGDKIADINQSTFTEVDDFASWRDPLPVAEKI